VGVDEEQARAIVAKGVLAPSGGNCQPWRFEHGSDGSILCYYDAGRAKNFLDFDLRATHLALGAATENMVIAAAAMGLDCQVEALPDDARSELVARLSFEPLRQPPPCVHLAPYIELRATNRELGKRTGLSRDVLSLLGQAAEEQGASLQLLTDARDLDRVAAVVAACDRFRLYTERLHGEMMAELRWTATEAEQSGDGVDVRTLGLSAAELPFLKLLRSWSVVRMLRGAGIRRPIELLTRRAIERSSAVGLLTVVGSDRHAYLRGGRALQRVWLTSTELGLAFQPLAVLPYLFARFEHGDGFLPGEAEVVGELHHQFSSCFAVHSDTAKVMLFRVGEAPQPSIRSARLPLDRVFTTDKNLEVCSAEIPTEAPSSVSRRADAAPAKNSSS
jgi:hypothetical protein